MAKITNFFNSEEIKMLKIVCNPPEGKTKFKIVAIYETSKGKIFFLNAKEASYKKDGKLF